MKFQNIILTLTAFLFIGFAANAQTLKPNLDISSQLLGILDNPKGLNLTGDQKSSLGLENKSFVEQLLKITSGTDSEEKKKSSILNLKDSRTKVLTRILGKQLLTKYTGSILKSIKPLKSKLGLAALAF